MAEMLNIQVCVSMILVKLILNADFYDQVIFILRYLFGWKRCTLDL